MSFLDDPERDAIYDATFEALAHLSRNHAMGILMAHLGTDTLREILPLLRGPDGPAPLSQQYIPGCEMKYLESAQVGIAIHHRFIAVESGAIELKPHDRKALNDYRLRLKSAFLAFHERVQQTSSDSDQS